MSIERFFTTLFTVRRQSWSGVLSSMSQVATFYGHLQPLQAELAETLGLTFTQAFTVWCPVDTNVQEGDEIEAGGVVYGVKAKQTHDYAPNAQNRHIELIAEKNLDYASA